jgi:hypothetical protein
MARKPKMSVEEAFKASECFEAFDQIPKSQKLHSRPDICAMLYMSKKMGGKGFIIDTSTFEAIYFGFSNNQMRKLNEADIVYLSRCGVFYDRDAKSLAMLTH